MYKKSTLYSFADYFLTALWNYGKDEYLAWWWSFFYLHEFTIEKRDDVHFNDNNLQNLMKDDFSRLFPWQTAEQFFALRGIHFTTKNVYDLPLRWIDFWTMPYELVWQHLAMRPEKSLWQENRLLFLQECVVAKWLCNDEKYCLLHVMIDKDDPECYNRIDIGFYLIATNLEPNFCVEDEKNHEKYTWKSDGNLALEMICKNLYRKCSYEELKKPI